MQHFAPPSTTYRPDIDGLRTLAVVPVVLFHAGIPHIEGGYVGVDVFFVISGFLITGIIARELTSGRFSLLEFYRRRARRIFPALTLVGSATLLVGAAVLTPQEFRSLGESAASIAIFGSNIYFWKSVSYFDPGVQPLLHTWSLAVEEQYYLFFPLFLMLMHGKRKWMIAGLWLIFGSSLLLSAMLVAAKPGAAFYLLPSRAWELMLGGLLALGSFGEARSERAGRIASATGLLLILVPVFTYDASTPFPGLAALPPVLGTALLIWGRGWGLSARPLVAIGLLSYSLYLWHVPVIEFAKYLTDGPLTLLGGVGASLLSLALAALTYRFVETPFRTARSRRRATVWAAATMPCLAAAAVTIIVLDGIPSRLSPQQVQQLAVVEDKQRHPSHCMSLDQRWVDPAEPCRFGRSPTTLLWGDSHAMVTASSMAAAKIPFHFAANADCPIGIGLAVSPDFTPAVTSQGHYRRCGEYNDRMLARALQDDVKTVVLSARWTNWRIGEPANLAEADVDIRLVDADGAAGSVRQNFPKFEKAFLELIQRLTSSGKKVIIVGPVPEPTYNVPHRLYISSFGFTGEPAPIIDYEARHQKILGIFHKVSKNPKVRFIWPAEALCAGNCPAVDRGMPVYFDHNHLTYDKARELAPLYKGLLQSQP